MTSRSLSEQFREREKEFNWALARAISRYWRERRHAAPVVRVVEVAARLHDGRSCPVFGVRSDMRGGWPPPDPRGGISRTTLEKLP